MNFRFRLLNDPRSITGAEAHELAKGLTNVFKVGAELLKLRGRAAIAAGGFGGKWQQAWDVRGPKGRPTLSPRIFAIHKIFYAGQFQDPETIAGRPFLWLPIKQNLPGGNWTPKKYAKQIGPLRGGRRGAGRPLLFGLVTVGRNGVVLKRKPRAGAKTRKVWRPVFVGVRTIRDPKRFDLVNVAEGVATEVAAAASKVIS